MTGDAPRGGGATATKPRILFFLPVLQVGGAERQTVDLCRMLRARGYPARIMVHGRARSPAMEALPTCSDAVFLDLKGMSDAVGWLTIWRKLRELKPDVIVAVNQTPLIITVLERLVGATRARIACVFHTIEMPDYERYQSGMFRWSARFIDLLVYVGANQRRVWESRGMRPRRTALIFNGIDTARFAAGRGRRDEIRAGLGLGPEDYLLGLLASFRPEKNHGELVSALAEARAAGTEARLLLVGEGDTRPAVVALAERLGVADRVIFAGEQRDVAPYLAACDVGILCSLSETFPLSALEFLAAGVPMIAAAVGGVTEIVRDGSNGLLYPSGDVAGLSRAIAALAEPRLRASLAARAEDSVARFSAETMADAYATAFDDLVRS